MVIETRNRQIGGAGHTYETKRSAREAAAAASMKVTGLDPLDFIMQMKEELGEKMAAKRSKINSVKDNKKRKVVIKDETLEYIDKSPDIQRTGLKPFSDALLADDKPLRDQDIAALLKKFGFNDPTHIYLACRNAKRTITKALNKFAFSVSIQAPELYLNRLNNLEVFIQNHMESHGQAVLAALNSGEEQTEFSKKGLGTPQVLRDYYRSVIKEERTVLSLYKNIIARPGGIANFATHCDFLMKFNSRHLECEQGKYHHNTAKMELTHNNIQLLRYAVSELERIHQHFSQYCKGKAEELEKFKHKVFEQVLTIVESVSVREAQVDGINSLCKVTDPIQKLSVINNLRTCIDYMPDPMFANNTAKMKVRMMILSISDKQASKAGETPEEYAKAQLYHKADGFKANAADPSLDPLKAAAYYPVDDIGFMDRATGLSKNEIKERNMEALNGIVRDMVGKDQSAEEIAKNVEMMKGMVSKKPLDRQTKENNMKKLERNFSKFMQKHKADKAKVNEIPENCATEADKVAPPFKPNQQTSV